MVHSCSTRGRGLIRHLCEEQHYNATAAVTVEEGELNWLGLGSEESDFYSLMPLVSSILINLYDTVCKRHCRDLWGQKFIIWDGVGTLLPIQMINRSNRSFSWLLRLIRPSVFVHCSRRHYTVVNLCRRGTNDKMIECFIL